MLKPIKLYKLEINPLLLPLLLFAIILDFAPVLLLTYLMVFLHEAAHAAAAVALGVKLDKIEVMPFGVSICIRGSHIKKPLHEALIAAAGPVCSGFLAYWFFKYRSDMFLAGVNAAIAAVNAIPALPLDGGRILKAVLTERWGYVKAFNFSIRLTRICAAVAVACGSAVLYYTKFNFSLLLIGAFLIVNTFSEQRSSAHIMINEILRSREKLSRNTAQRAEHIAIAADTPARKALKLLGYNKYYFINVVDDNMNLMGTITETRLIEQLAQKGIRTKAANMVDFDCQK